VAVAIAVELDVAPGEAEREPRPVRRLLPRRGGPGMAVARPAIVDGVIGASNEWNSDNGEHGDRGRELHASNHREPGARRL
jgi:hypothetical protein